MNAAATCLAPVSLVSGGVLGVRRAAPADREPLLQMFGRCSADTRYRRFHGPVKTLPAGYLTEALSGCPFHYALVAWHQEQGEPEPEPESAGPGEAPALAAAGPPARLVALASCRLVAEGAAELGLLVEDAWQRQGAGTRLLRDLVAYADSIGVRVLEAQLLAEQSWITSLLRPYGPGRLRSSRHGVMTVTVRRG
ncbi:MAG TPA: GNAT family N-acetyltransferase [Trebonia sp.]|nr:GNAT family N-acetyltransferase [Trebonia sp.]